ncbi:hypothetical protein BN1708_019154, partial [Verticillium longisporum]
SGEEAHRASPPRHFYQRPLRGVLQLGDPDAQGPARLGDVQADCQAHARTARRHRAPRR